MRSLLIRGRVLADSAVIEPIFMLPTPGADASGRGGDYELRGLDVAGDVLFSAVTETTAVAGPLPETERHFELTVPIDEEAAARLERIELRVGERLLAERISPLMTTEFARVVDAQDAVTAERLADGRVRLAWDPIRFPAVLITDPATGQVLSFGRAGEATVRTSGSTLDLALSDGVRSRTRTVRVDR